VSASNVGAPSAPGNRSTYRPTSHMRRQTKAARPALGSWFTPQAAIRTESSSCRISTHYWLHGRQSLEPYGALIATALTLAIPR
jgi:hypothetical protein